VQVVKAIKKVQGEAESTNLSAISKTAVRLVPQSSGSKGTKENKQAGNERGLDPWPRSDFFDDGGNQFQIESMFLRKHQAHALHRKPEFPTDRVESSSVTQQGTTGKFYCEYILPANQKTLRGVSPLRSSRFLPLPWQHHAWLAPAHRKTLRQQPF
jgi:hypothetical protein